MSEALLLPATVNLFPEPAQLLADLVAIPGPPGQEDAVRGYLITLLDQWGIPHRTDAKGNLLASPGDVIPDRPSVVVTAHMDEIALLVTGIEHNASQSQLVVAPLGGLYPWKWGEGPVDILPLRGGKPMTGILSFGSIHTSSSMSPAQAARDGRSITWGDARIATGRPVSELREQGIRTGSRVVMARARRQVTELGGNLVGSYFFDDRADCVAWILALRTLRDRGEGADTLFIATTSEEVGGEGVQFALQSLAEPPAICVALEIGPSTPETPLLVDEWSTVWVSDSYATMQPIDVALLQEAASHLGGKPVFQVLTRGGSDASCAASRGLCARPVTLAFAAENSHGFEIMHRDAPENLAKLLVAYLQCVAAE